jgi:hypothetical protein
MRGRAALLSCALALATPALAAAQSVAPDPALRSVAGPRAAFRMAEDGRVRAILGARVAAWSGDPERDALAFVQRFGRELGIPRSAELRVERVTAAHGFTIVRLRRFEAGRPVIGATVVVRFLADRRIDFVAIDAGPAAAREASPAIDAPRARQAAAAHADAAVDVGEAFATAIALPDEVVPLWAVDVRGASIASAVRVLVDATDGRVLGSFPLATHAMGRVYATNPATDMSTTTDVVLDLAPGAARLAGAVFQVASCNAQPDGRCAPSQYAAADASGDFLYDPTAGAFDDPFAEVNAYHHLSRAAAYHRDQHGFSFACTTLPMTVLVNYSDAPRVAHENAAFSPGSRGQCGLLVFGQGASADYAYDGDVVYHEHGHAVTDQVAGITGFIADVLGLSYEPLAVNEGTSDYWAGTIQGNGSIAESFSGFGVGSHGSLRVIDNDLACPGALFGEGHYDGRIWSGAAWDAREAIGAEFADAIVFTAVASLTDSPTLSDAADTMIATAMGMEAMGSLGASDVAAVEAAVAAHSLAGCQRVVPLDDGDMHLGWSGSETLTAGLGRSIAPVHYRIEVPADATAVHFRMGRATITGTHALHFRVGVPVRVSVARVTSQLRVDGSPDLVVDESTVPFGLPLCQTLFVAIESTDLGTAGQSVYTISASVDRSGDPLAECPASMIDGGVDGGAPGEAGPTPMPRGGGCSCSAGERSARGSVLLLVGLLAVVGRRFR